MRKKLHRFFYGLVFCIALCVFYCAYFFKFSGRKNMPKGAAVFCANHSSALDPIYLSLAAGLRHPVNYMAKKELFKNKLVAVFISWLGAFPVDRSISDINAIKTAMRLLKEGQNVGIFPEGTRVSEDDAVSAKSGAVRLAVKMDVPLVPVYIPREKKVFRRMHIVIGEPFYIEKKGKFTGDDYAALSEELMRRIEKLKPEAK